MSTVPQSEPPVSVIGRSILVRRRGMLFERAAELLIRAAGLVTVALLVGILILLARQGLRLFISLDYPVSRFFTYDNAITENTTDPSQFRFGVL
ncbi:MAG TPA: hypothetical protein VLS25_08685, partial [Dehalococcoidia bacterium]|nr:hypothetical protein [Dehalococcoidia bacterium]